MNIYLTPSAAIFVCGLLPVAGLIPMAPFTPFRETGGKVVKRSGGPYAASFEENGDDYSVKWDAKQMGGEQREAPRISPEMQQQIDELRSLLRR